MFIHEEKKGKNEKKSLAFQDSISKFIDYVTENKEENHRILNICNQFNFQRRRFYDVLNILEALGICHKLNTDTFSWLGFEKITTTITNKIQEKGIMNPNIGLEIIFPMEEKILISKLTINFILCFVAIQEQCLSLQAVAQYLSRNNNRFKTTLCKLYQIVYILVLIGVIEKRSVPSEVALTDKYYNTWCVTNVKMKDPTHFSKQMNVPMASQIPPNINSSPIQGSAIGNPGSVMDAGVPSFILARRAAFYAVPPPRRSSISTDSD